MRQFVPALMLVLLSAPALAAMQAKPVEWQVDKQSYRGFLVYDGANVNKRPGLVMVPNWMGVTESAVEKAKQVAGDDYVVLVADVYGKDVHPTNASEAGEQARKAYADGGASLRARANEAVRVLKAQAGAAPLDTARIGVFGFCFGGAVALEVARSGSDVAGVVSLHGDLETYLPAAANKIRTSILVLNGADDSSVSDAHVAAFEKEMDAANADWQFVDFSGAVHCFTQPESNSPPNCVYNERASNRAFEMLHDFFRERFAAVP